MKYSYTKAELKQKKIKDFSEGDIIECGKYELHIYSDGENKLARIFMSGYGKIPKFINDFRNIKDEDGFIKITLKNVTDSIGFRHFDLYYCANHKNPNKECFVNTCLFNDKAYFERWCKHRKEDLCNSENGNNLKFYIKA